MDMRTVRTISAHIVIQCYPRCSRCGYVACTYQLVMHCVTITYSGYNRTVIVSVTGIYFCHTGGYLSSSSPSSFPLSLLLLPLPLFPLPSIMLHVPTSPHFTIPIIHDQSVHRSQLGPTQFNLLKIDEI